MQTTAVTVGQTPEVFGKPEINGLLDEWEQIAGYKIQSNVASNRRAVSNLLKKHGHDGMIKALRGVRLSLDDKYAPRIGDFRALQSRWDELMAWGVKYQQNNGGKPRVGVVK